MKLAANISWLFKEELDLLKRLKLAKDSGFDHVELAWPFEYTIDDFVKAVNLANVKIVLINTPLGSNKGDMGLASVPGRKADFRADLEKTIEYAKAVNCPAIHIMVGNVTLFSHDQHRQTLIDNLKMAESLLAQHNIKGHLEPINTHISAPKYFLKTPSEAFSIINELNSTQFTYQCDFYHLQVQCGNVTRFLEENIARIGYIQISQVPNRNEPDSPGELNFEWLFGQLKKLNYTGYIGLEYTPAGDTVTGLSWIADYQQK